MQLQQELGDVRYLLRGISAEGVLVSDKTLTRSFILAPQQLIEDWAVSSSVDLKPEDLSALLALNPVVILLGTGPRQVFPAPPVMAAALIRGVGIEVMDSAAAARTFNVLASEGRKVVAGFVV